MISSCIRQRFSRSLPLLRSKRAFSAPAAAADAAQEEAPAVVETLAEDAAVIGPPPIVWTTNRLNQGQISKVDAIFHKILWLDMFETSMLNDLVNERLGLTMSPKQRAALQRQMDGRGGKSTKGSGGAVAEKKDEGPKLVDLKLTGFDAKSKIKVIKEVRSIAGLGLKEAKELVEGFPKTIQKELKPEQAEELKAKLEAVGATIELV